MSPEMTFLLRMRREIDVQSPEHRHRRQMHDRDGAAEDIGHGRRRPVRRAAHRQRHLVDRHLSEQLVRVRLVQRQAPRLRDWRSSRSLGIETILPDHQCLRGRREDALRAETRGEGPDDLVRCGVDDLDACVGGRGADGVAWDGEVGEFPVGRDARFFAAGDRDFAHEGFSVQVDDGDVRLGFVARVCLAAVGRHGEPVGFGFARDLLGDRAGGEIDPDQASSLPFLQFLDADVEDVSRLIEDKSVRTKGGEDVDGLDTGFCCAIYDADFVAVVAVLPKEPMAVGVAYVEEVPLRVEAKFVGLGNEVGEICGPLAGREVKEAEAFTALADYC